MKRFIRTLKMYLLIMTILLPLLTPTTRTVYAASVKEMFETHPQVLELYKKLVNEYNIERYWVVDIDHDGTPDLIYHSPLDESGLGIETIVTYKDGQLITLKEDENPNKTGLTAGYNLGEDGKVYHVSIYQLEGVLYFLEVELVDGKIDYNRKWTSSKEQPIPGESTFQIFKNDKVTKSETEKKILDSIKVDEDTVKKSILKNDAAFAEFTQKGQYDFSKVDIKPSSEMETGWKEDIERNKNNGTSYEYIETTDILVKFESDNYGYAEYTKALRGIQSGSEYRDRCYAYFEVNEGKVQFVLEFDNKEEFEAYKVNNGLQKASEETEKISTEASSDIYLSTGEKLDLTGKITIRAVGAGKSIIIDNFYPESWIYYYQYENGYLIIGGRPLIVRDGYPDAYLKDGIYKIPFPKENFDKMFDSYRQSVESFNQSGLVPDVEGLYFSIEDGEVQRYGLAGGGYRTYYDKQHGVRY